MNPLQERHRAAGAMRLCFGGDSSSSSTSNININAPDNRSVDNSVNNSGNTNINNSVNTTTNTASGNTIGEGASIRDSFNSVVSTSVTNVSTDYGAVSKAFEATSQNSGMVMTLADRMLGGYAEMAKKNADMTSQLSAGTAAAYQGAANTASGMNTMMIIAAAVVGLAFAFRG